MAKSIKKTGSRTSTPLTIINDKIDNMDADKKKIALTTIKIVLVMLVLLLIVSIWRNRVDLSFSNMAQCARDLPAMSGAGEGFPASVSGGQTVLMDELSGGIAVLSDNSLTIFNKHAKVAASRAHFMSSPIMKTAGRYALLSDVGGKGYRLETASSTVLNSTAEHTILGCAVARDGSFALVMEGGTMLSTVEVRSRSGEVLHKWSTSTCYITNAALSADGRYLAMSGINAVGGKLVSTVIIHRVGYDSEVARIELNDDVLLALEFTNTDVIFAVGSSGYTVISDYGESYETTPADGQIVCCDISYDSGAVVFVTPTGSSEGGELIGLDTRGNIRFTKQSAMYGSAVCISSDGCCLLGRGSAEIYRLSGELVTTCDTGPVSSDAMLIGSKLYTLDGINLSETQIK